MLGQALSFALVKQRFEPLHATVVVVDDQAVAFLGDNASGKSSLAACFLEAGYRLLTDDLLMLQESSNRVLAYPGPPRLKLFPKIASRFLGRTANRVQMNPDTEQADPADRRASELRQSRGAQSDLLVGGSPRRVPEARREHRDALATRGLRGTREGHIQPSARGPAAVGATIRGNGEPGRPLYRSRS